MFPPSARTGAVQDYPQYRGVQNFFHILASGGISKAWNWETDDGIFSESTIICDTGYSVNSCGCCGSNPYPPYDCYACEATNVYSQSYYPSFGAAITDGYYSTTTRSGWKYIAQATNYACGSLYDCGAGNCTYNNCTNGTGSTLNYLKSVNGNLLDGGDTDSGSIGIKEDGTLWAWGGTGYMLVAGWNSGAKNDPYQLGTDKWKAISAFTDYGIGNLAVLAIKTNGTLWAWGINTSGQLGDGTTTNRYSPVQIGSDTNWDVVEMSAYTAHAIKTDGTLWGWGFNANGNIGDGTGTAKSSPVQIGTGTNWKQISGRSTHTLAVKTDGTAWGWGSNVFGNIGDGTTTFRASPVQIGTGTNWRKVFVNRDSSSAGIKTDGTLWGWGNGSPNYGTGTTGTRSSPVQMGSANTDHLDFVYAAAYTDNPVLITTDRKKMVYYAYASTTRYSANVLNGPYYPVGDAFQNHKTFFTQGGFGSILKSGR